MFFLPVTISIAFLAPFATARTLPFDLSDGNYAVYINATGHEVYIKASEVGRLTEADFAVTKRDVQTS